MFVIKNIIEWQNKPNGSRGFMPLYKQFIDLEKEDLSLESWWR